jgi:putative hemolysin
MFRTAAAVSLWILSLPVAHAADQRSMASAEAYCTATGGAVQTRIPTYGTNNPNTLALSEPRAFCDYASADGSTNIYVLLSTLVSKTPTLAALAYYAEVPYVGTGCNGSPGSCYCSQIGGTDLFGGINAAGGGWVLNTNSSDVVDACIFPDLSSIDTYGLFYHSANIIRGRNLAHKLRYKNPNP